MNKKIVLIIPVLIIAVFMAFLAASPEKEDNVVFHITLAEPELYVDGAYTDVFTIDSGEYYFRFVPNGSSPEILSITLDGDGFDFYEDFKLESTWHPAGGYGYYTWEYDGEETIVISEMQEISITINPNENVMGSVSVDILKK